MNVEKARDYFSAYLEGTLEPSLKLAFERKLAEDTKLAAEYRAFSETISALNAMREEQIDIPIYLSDRIATRLEQIQERKRSGGIWSLWLPRIAFVGVAGVSILGAILSLQGGFGPASTAQTIPIQAAADRVTFKFDANENFAMSFQATQPRTIVVSSWPSGTLVDTIELEANKDLTSPLTNDQSEAAILAIRVEGDRDQTLVALPGTSPSVRRSGQGTLAELSKAVAGTFRVQVILTVSDPGQVVNWTLEGTDAYQALNGTIDRSRYSVEKMDRGVVRISSAKN